jgi:hypothetical protein
MREYEVLYEPSLRLSTLKCFNEVRLLRSLNGPCKPDEASSLDESMQPQMTES